VKAQSKIEVEWNQEIGGDFNKELTQMVSNRLRLLSVLKGKSAEEIDVITLEWKPDTIVLSNSDFAEFRIKLLLPTAVPVVIDGQTAGFGEIVQGSRTPTVEPEYLVYLRRIDG